MSGQVPQQGVPSPGDNLTELWTEYGRACANNSITASDIDDLRIELVFNSNAIEGISLSLDETRHAILGEPIPSKEREALLARNHYRAIRVIEEWSSRRVGQRIAEQDMRDLHAELFAGVDGNIGGKYRAGRVLLAGTGFVPPAPHKVMPMLAELFDGWGIHPDSDRSWKNYTPVRSAAHVHYQIAAIHPFEDGNGRVARLMMNYYLLRSDIPPCIISVDRRAEYIDALCEANQGRFDPFFGFIDDCLRKTILRILKRAS